MGGDTGTKCSELLGSQDSWFGVNHTRLHWSSGESARNRGLVWVGHLKGLLVPPPATGWEFSSIPGCSKSCLTRPWEARGDERKELSPSGINSCPAGPDVLQQDWGPWEQEPT